MPRSKRQIERAVTLNGIPLIWKLHREQHYSLSDGWSGLAIQVTVAQGTRRELFLEYPPIQTQKIASSGTDHATINIRPAKIEEHILQAMEAGWDPESRGKPYVHEVHELPY